MSGACFRFTCGEATIVCRGRGQVFKLHFWPRNSPLTFTSGSQPQLTLDLNRNAKNEV